MIKFLLLFSLFCLSTGVANAGDENIVFNPRVTLPDTADAEAMLSIGFKKIPGDEALNQWAIDFETGGFESRTSSIGQSEWKNLYLAFAIDVRYLRDCFGGKTTALCTFYHSGIQLSADLSWSDVRSSDRYAVIVVPVEYITGTFGKEGLDLRTTHGALYAALGTRAEYLRDLGLEVQNRILGAISASINYASPEQGLGADAAFHWIGSIRIFAGGAATEMSQLPTQGTLSGGIETQIGLALDLAKGTIAFTNTTRLEGDIGFGDTGLHNALTSNKVELKFLRSICQDAKAGGCTMPRLVSYGGGIRYEYTTSSYEGATAGGPLNSSQSVHRLIFFAEIARF